MIENDHFYISKEIVSKTYKYVGNFKSHILNASIYHVNFVCRSKLCQFLNFMQTLIKKKYIFFWKFHMLHE
jgi:hypothetical protein